MPRKDMTPSEVTDLTQKLHKEVIALRNEITGIRMQQAGLRSRVPSHSELDDIDSQLDATDVKVDHLDKVFTVFLESGPEEAKSVCEDS